ncbi:MAG: DUF58 domain-containing protein [Colwellia sp.]
MKAIKQFVKVFIKTFIKSRFDRWLKRRIPSAFEHQLTSRNIFILPTRFGFAYLFFVLLLFLLGTNYQNNIILLFSYLLASLFITIMIHSFYNLSHLVIKSSAKKSGFCQQKIDFPIVIKADKTYFDLNFTFTEQNKRCDKEKLAQCSKGHTELLLPFFAQNRGEYTLGRVKISSEYSLGLFITWTILDFDHQVIVFPKPKTLESHQLHLTGLNESDHVIQQNNIAGIDDFSELKHYVVGEPRSRIAWKQLARGQGRFTKHYQEQKGGLTWLKLQDMPSHNREIQLSFLCFLVLEHSCSNQVFGLALGKVNIEPASGFQHQQACLTALALYHD